MQAVVEKPLITGLCLCVTMQLGNHIHLGWHQGRPTGPLRPGDIFSSAARNVPQPKAFVLKEKAPNSDFEVCG